MTLNRLTPHQAEVFQRLARIQRRTGREVMESNVGSVGALEHLRAKGWLAQGPSMYGSRGGEYRTWCVAPEAQHKVSP